jgi:hypothetical protein
MADIKIRIKGGWGTFIGRLPNVMALCLYKPQAGFDPATFCMKGICSDHYTRQPQDLLNLFVRKKRKEKKEKKVLSRLSTLILLIYFFIFWRLGVKSI